MHFPLPTLSVPLPALSNSKNKPGQSISRKQPGGCETMLVEKMTSESKLRLPFRSRDNTSDSPGSTVLG